MTDATPLKANSSMPDYLLPEPASSSGLAIFTEKLQNRHRRISASICIPCSVEQVWEALTDYDNLANFIPNLSVSRCLETADSRTLLEQVGSQCFLNIQFCARVVLDMAEQFPHRISFSMVEGDFKAFEGCWRLESEAASQPTTRLNYELTICPPLAVPVMLIERHLRHDLTQNLQAIRQHMIISTSAA
ncbi:MAG: SRPBCC family protein [Cyanobacteria bacterium P01_C01_bin.120]